MIHSITTGLDNICACLFVCLHFFLSCLLQSYEEIDIIEQKDNDELFILATLQVKHKVL